MSVKERLAFFENLAKKDQQSAKPPAKPSKKPEAPLTKKDDSPAIVPTPAIKKVEPVKEQSPTVPSDPKSEMKKS